MKRVAFALFAIAAWVPSRASAQQPLPQLPPSSPASSAAPIPPPPPPPEPPGAPPAMVDATSAPPSVTLATPAPAPYQPMTHVEPYGGEGAYEHDGFYLRVTTGFGLLGLGGTGPTGANASLGGGATVGRLLIGGTPARGFVVGGMIEGVNASSVDFGAASAGLPTHGWSGAMGTLGAFVDWFPSPHHGWHLGGQLGLTGVAVANDAAQTSWAGGALSSAVFGGYDFWLGPQWSLGLEGVVGVASRAKMQDGHGDDVGYRFGAADFGLEATLLYH